MDDGGDIADANGSPASPNEPLSQQRKLPSDLPTSLDDRRAPAYYTPGVEVYDAWQGQSQVLTTPAPVKPFDFNLALDDSTFDEGYEVVVESDDARLNKMMATRVALSQDASVAENNDVEVANREDLGDAEKKEILQKSLNMAASNGDEDRLKALLSEPALSFIDFNLPDDDGTPPLIYASCFGNDACVAMLADAGARIDVQDKGKWTPLMWATANRHTKIMKTLLDRGASTDVQSLSGRTAFDFVTPNSDISDYLLENGYKIGSAGIGDDFYDNGLSQDRFEEEMAENEMKRRMMMESAINLEVDLGNLGLDEQPESPEELEEESQGFQWDRCLNDQMFVFQESELDQILDVIITNMTPQRSASQKPVPANIIFLSARYAHYHADSELLALLLESAMKKITDVIERFQWDMTVMAFWMSNATLLLHYLKKDTHLVTATTHFQLLVSELINDIYIYIIRDAERRMDKVFDQALLDHETIPGFEDVQFQHEWKLFKSKPKAQPDPPEKRYRPPSPKRRAQISPRNITSLLASTVFVLDLYDIHSVITAQILSQLLYWLGAELFNRIVSNRKFLARTKAMQIRMNVSVLEDWARGNNRQPEHYENGSMTSVGENTIDAARRHLAPVIQLLQWLQVFSTLPEGDEALDGMIKQLPRLAPQHLVHAVKYYRPETTEKGLPKPALKRLQTMQKELTDRKNKRKSMLSSMVATFAAENDKEPDPMQPIEEDDVPENLLLDTSLMLPFHLPTSTDLLITFGAGFGGVNKDRAMKYVPTVPPEFLAKLDLGGKKPSNLYNDSSFNDLNDD